MKKWLDDVFLYGWAYGSKGDKLKNRKVSIIVLSCAVLSGAFLGFNNTRVSGDESSPDVKQLADLGSKPEMAMEELPQKIVIEIQIPEELPFDNADSESTAISKEFGNGVYYYEEYWEDNGKYFFFNVLTDTPEADKEYLDNPDFSYKNIKLDNGIEATYVAGPTSEKIYWNENGFQYMIGSNSPNGSQDFYGI